MNFLESAIPKLNTIAGFINIDSHSRKGKTYEVETFSLQDLLTKIDVPKVFDYLCINTEGSELDILNNFDFEKFKFRVIAVKHNFKINS